MEWIYDDGGRAEAGFKGKTRDCTCRAIAIATGRPYREVYDELNQFVSKERPPRSGRRMGSARQGVRRMTIRRYLKSLGWEWHPVMKIGSGCTMHLATAELPLGRLIVSLSRHLTAVVGGQIRDTYDPSRDGTRCVYGYWTPPSE